VKVWIGHGSEHSANIVMIGTFRREADALKAKMIFEKVQALASSISEQERIDRGEAGFSEAMLNLLIELGVHSLGPADPDTFATDHSLDLNGSTLTVRTDEPNVGAFLSVLMDGGAKVEVFSAHDYPTEADGA
jgi:hypothetical protein